MLGTTLTDLLSTLVALAAVTLSLIDPARFHRVDHIGGIVIGVIVILIGVRLGRYTVEQLVDTMPNEKLMSQIRIIALAVPGSDRN